jgi:hypothetical protein
MISWHMSHVSETTEEDTLEQQTDQDRVTEQAPKQRSFVGRWLKALFKTLAYAVFLVISIALGLWGVERLSQYALSRSYFGQVYPKNPQMALRDYTRPVSHYDYDFVPGTCVEYNTNKGNRFEYANNAGFREPRNIEMQKPADEFRIFLTGGSTAFGMGAGGDATAAMGWYSLTYRETISHMMEQILNTTDLLPGKKIRVYNTAVWGYGYQHLLMRYMTKLRRYNPDMIISFDGANEVPLLCRLRKDWDYFQEGQYSYLLRQIFSYNRPGLASYLTLWLKNNTYFMSYIWSGKDLFVELNRNTIEEFPDDRPDVAGESAPQSLEGKSGMVDQNIGTIVRMIENYHSVLDNDNVAHIFALQPWFYLSKKPLHEKEKIVAGLKGHRDYHGIPSDKMYKLFVDKARESAGAKGIFLADFTEYFDDVSEWVFTDWCHLTAEANYLIAKELSNLVKERFFQKPLTQGDRIEEKDTLFWDIVASGKVVYAPPAESADTGPERMFTGYPTDALYASKPLPADAKLEVVVDMGKPFSVSRLRVVWADEASVPDEWIVETSADQQTWQAFVKARKNQNDTFDRWPGFEYYAAEPVSARFLRYRPVSGEQKTIRLRLWSMFR